MIRVTLVALSLVATGLLFAPTAVSDYFAPSCVGTECCKGAVDSGCGMCLEWHYHQPPPPEANGTWHCHHSVNCYRWVAGVCYCGGAEIICDATRLD